jgi:hypothetical protein
MFSRNLTQDLNSSPVDNIILESSDTHDIQEQLLVRRLEDFLTFDFLEDLRRLFTYFTTLLSLISLHFSEKFE